MDLDAIRLTWFTRAWAIAALFHLLGNSREALIKEPSLALTSMFLGVASIFAFLVPEKRRNLTGLCAIIPIHAWLEAPVVGNHWVLAALISITCLLTVLHRSFIPTTQWSEFLTPARLTLLTAYSFAALAKINADFLNPIVSCAVYYQDQLVTSWGLSNFSVSGSPILGRAAAVLTMLTELSIAALLMSSRTRRAGLLVAFSFHWLLAMDLNQHFWDFSSVLFAGFILFLDDEQVAYLTRHFQWRGYLQTKVDPLRYFILLFTVIAVTVNIFPLPEIYAMILQDLGHSAWWIYGTGALGAVLLSLWSRKPPMKHGSIRRPFVPLLLATPILAGLNGLTPYLEIKTGFSWNMYSNLRTVAGKTNHLLLPGTLDLTGSQRELVYILDSSDPELLRLHDKHYALTHSEFIRYTREFPHNNTTYRYKNEIRRISQTEVNHMGDLNNSILTERLFAFRSIDLNHSERCRPDFSPAR